MDDFYIMFGMDFLLEHKVILMPLAKSLVLMRSNPMIILNTWQLEGVKMMLAL